ncbi:hypothetical protein J2Q11_13895 [Tenacibaculum finnmarkense genomovar finnmarkense]|uniref:hypothetical protein n=1 Tax=Tenacibaculum finnmarkense TaxID=2781243 RepID=UPI001E47C93D|nr:hypothetical protein [Tenacibaculum finnmarkense]MCD8426029.1 hypothetical protein [Tenacibaculum dicentrarchi]MCD8418818.1 hypothetical protein [Tenacibaculum finnmarkense genomovar finnmarkense]MCG8187115.1 hypothetical protein [Tenacibaculum finnmarkense genomovar finnmarkense]MCG8203683.1 hypothetical protein [Tenacibaculum finnmarkense genomovar finnmarkense]MCG8211161.1 hypothetical protein [Tenacibaculum finnmarkense genomovar finnmarkense]
MKTYFTDIIPKLQRFSQKLDNLTLLTNQHWVVVDEINTSKNVYIFRSDNSLLISQNGKVERANWEYLGNNSILIDKNNELFLFKHGFFDENILALKIDGKDEYAFLVNENKYNGELNSIEKVFDFLNKKYIESNNKIERKKTPIKEKEYWKSKNENGNWIIKELEGDWTIKEYKTYNGTLLIRCLSPRIHIAGDRVYLNGKPAKDGKYDLDWYLSINVKNGMII